MRMKAKRSLIGYDSKSIRAWLNERHGHHDRLKMEKQTELQVLREDVERLRSELQMRPAAPDHDEVRRRFERELAEVFMTSVARDEEKRQAGTPSGNGKGGKPS